MPSFQMVYRLPDKNAERIFLYCRSTSTNLPRWHFFMKIYIFCKILIHSGGIFKSCKEEAEKVPPFKMSW